MTEDLHSIRQPQEHALRVLEFPQVLERIAARATSAAGRRAVLRLHPGTDPDQIRSELDRVQELRRLLAAAPRWAMPLIPELESPLEHLASQGTLEGAELHEIGILLSSGGSAAELLGHDESQAPTLRAAVRLLHVDDEMAGQIQGTVDEAGVLQDRASDKLRAVRRELREARAALVGRLEGFLRGLPDRLRVPDASMTIRDGRYCIAIRREGRRSVGGIVHDESATGATLFVEPPIAIRLMNELRAMEREEMREVARILGEWSDRLRPLSAALLGSLAALVRLDSLFARALTAERWDATVPEIAATDHGTFEVVDGRHPLLLEEGGVVVPFTVCLDPHERVLIVSGPNTGGKSVFLKAMGLLPALAQSGVVPPVGPGSRFPTFERFLADIGDEQSIAANLSTFSAHLANLAEIVTEARRGTLALIDELGTGTDPIDGAPLSRAIIEELVASGARTLVTTHLGKLKEMDTGDASPVANASLQFDGAAGAPTYAFHKGRPGRSYGLAIARGLGFPSALIDRAESLRGAGEQDLEQLLERTARHEQELAATLARVEKTDAESTALRAELQLRDSALRERETAADDRAQRMARDLLLQARTEVEATIEELRAHGDAEEDLRDASRTARGRVERAARALIPEGQPSSAPPVEVETPRPGDRVRMLGTGATGIVQSVRGARADVTVGTLRMEVPLNGLTRIDSESGNAVTSDVARPSTGGTRIGFSGDASPEADLRGLRLDEVEMALAKALDNAILNGLTQLRIIHGKGMGTVRRRVEELLRAEGRVEDFRLGRHGEGGAGVTVVTFP